MPNEIIGVSSIALSQTSVKITKGNSVILTATVSPTNATDKTLIWSSSNPAVATVEGGVVRGIAEGTATITVEANDGSGVKTTCSVEVVAGTGVTGSSNGHDYVDLGMKDSHGRTIYWATCNIGAESPEDYGLHFAWGETEGHSSNKTTVTQPDGYSFDWSTAPFNNGSYGYDEAYFYSVKDEVCPGGVLAPEYDAAHVNWKGDWRMPTDDELIWLRNTDNCTWTWDSTRKGYTVTSKTTGASIFLPASGDRYDLDLGHADTDGYYWSSTLCASEQYVAYRLYFDSSDVNWYHYYRYLGQCIRPVYGGDDLPNEIIGVSSIALSQTSVQITKGNSVTLTATVSPANATDKTLIWSSSNPAVATVEDGVVRGIAEGTATITVEANDGSGVKNTCSVEVVAGTGVTGSSNGHDYVDLGMKDSQGRTIYWATCNVGADSPEDYGHYFAWGETEGHSSNKTDGNQPDGYSFDWSTAPFNNGSSDFNESYFNSVKDDVCPDGILSLEYDAAHVNWQGDWRMPTGEELEWLRNSNNCVWTWDSTTQGYTVTSKTTGVSIFLPAAGGRYAMALFFAGSEGDYWTSSLDASYPYGASNLTFNPSDSGWGYNNRFLGWPVRPVCVLSE